MHFKQSGFAHQIALIAIVVVAAIAGVGYMVFKNNDSNKTTSSNSTSTNSAAENATSSKSADEAGAKAAAKKHFTLVYAKKYEEAYNNETCKEFRNLTNYEKFFEYLKNPGFQTIDLSSVEYTSVDARNNQAVIIGSVGPLDPESNLKVSLLKKDGSWCVYGYSIE